MKKIYIIPEVEFDEIIEDDNILAGSGSAGNAYTDLGSGGGSDNRSDWEIETDDDDDATTLSKGGFLFAEADFEYSL